MCECKITPKNTPKEEKEMKKEWELEKGVPRRPFQKPVKVFPSANTKFCGTVQREARPYTHIHNIKHITPKIHMFGQQHNFDLTHSMIG